MAGDAPWGGGGGHYVSPFKGGLTLYGVLVWDGFEDGWDFGCGLSGLLIAKTAHVGLV